MRWIYLALALALLIGMGCIGGNQQAVATPQGGNQGGAGSSQGNVQTPGSQGTQGSQGSGVINTIAQALMAGKGVKCEITYELNGKETKFTVYKKAGNERIEANDESLNFITITKTEGGETVYYIKVNTEEQPPELAECDWIKYAGGEESYSQAEDVEVEEDWELDMKTHESGKVKYKCQVEDVPESMFEVSGKVCDIEEMLGNFGYNYGG